MMDRMRFGGLSSGIDTHDMVDQMMRVERMRVDRFHQRSQTIQWRQEAAHDMNKRVAQFILDSRQNFGLNQVSYSGQLRASEVNRFDWIKSAQSSNEAAIRARADANAIEGNHEVKVNKRANVGSITSQSLKEKKIASEDGRSFDFGDDETRDLTIRVGDSLQTFTVENGSSISSLATRIRNATDDSGNSLGLNASYDANFGRMMITTRETGKEQHFQVMNTDLGSEMFSFDNDNEVEGLTTVHQASIGLDDYIDENGKLMEGTMLRINGDEYTIGNGDGEYSSLQEIMDQINKTEGFTAAYGNGVLMLSREEDGSGAFDVELNHEEINDGVITTITSDEMDVINRSGQDASIDFNGETITHHSNDISIFGINLNLEAGAQAEDVININVATDTDGMVEKIRGFVEDYNKLIDDVNEQLKAEEYRDYKPLTDEQRQAMSDNEVEMWEERAKSGLLRNDDSLSRMLQNLRVGMYEKVEGATGAFNQITQLGITTGNYQDGGKLVIDEDRLRDAINEDAEGVVNLLFKTSSEDDPAARRSESGLFQRMSDEMVSGMQDSVRRLGVGEHADKLRSVQGNMLVEFVTRNSGLSVSDRDIMSIDQQINRQEQMLMRREEQLWAQFTAMEKAMAEMNSQADSLQQQLMQL
ncbi:MAG: hypothetical protein D5S00_02950 [Tindallia sp. MSAO_Bac2]|nr:MAG: hypothetical protein D5S00_02950 [Tindallia sp. MSAO_Bac2]